LLNLLHFDLFNEICFYCLEICLKYWIGFFDYLILVLDNILLQLFQLSFCRCDLDLQSFDFMLQLPDHLIFLQDSFILLLKLFHDFLVFGDNTNVVFFFLL